MSASRTPTGPRKRPVMQTAEPLVSVRVRSPEEERLAEDILQAGAIFVEDRVALRRLVLEKLKRGFDGGR